VLVDRALGGDPPMLAINPCRPQDEKSEQRGFANLIKGVFGMFRIRRPTPPRPLGHAARGCRGRDPPPGNTVMWRGMQSQLVDD
jgi:hypothetical protein